MRNLCVILADQLNQEISSLNNFNKDLDEILICELKKNFNDNNHHKKKIVYQISCMRHFGIEMDALGFKVNYLKLNDPNNKDSYASEILDLIGKKGIDRIIVTESSSHDEMESIKQWQGIIGLDVEIRKNDLFMCDKKEFEEWATGRKELRLEFFYRMLRRKYDVLMDGDQPEGGAWNFDKNNPSIMFTTAILVSAIMLIKVVPVFAKMYEGMGVALPKPTEIIMSMSDFLRGTGGLVLFLSIIIFTVAFKILTTKNEAIRFKWHKQVLKMPIFGDLILKSLLARISLIMGNLSAAGVNLLESLEIAKSVSSNVVVSEALENVKKGVFSGDTLTKLFLKEPLFPPTFSQLISVGEQTGQLDEMFNSVAQYYEEEFDNSVDNMSSLIEPIMIVFMGVMIGGLMIAMYSPIFNVGALIG